MEISEHVYDFDSRALEAPGIAPGTVPSESCRPLTPMTWIPVQTEAQGRLRILAIAELSRPTVSVALGTRACSGSNTACANRRIASTGGLSR